MLKLITACLLTGITLWAQGSTAQISGTIRDSTGAAIPAAEVKVTQVDTGLVRTTNAGAAGEYLLPTLPIGPYKLEVAKDGFTKYLQQGIMLQVASNPTIDVLLTVGSVQQEVTVDASTAMVETRTTALGTVIDNNRVLEMPLNGRNPIELVFLSGMASTAAFSSSLNSGVRNYPTIIVSVAGSQGNAVSYLLDGAIYQDPFNSGSLPLPFPDAMQEFKVETSALPAQYGFHSGAAVNALTKSGTNQFHGDLFEFFRNGDLNARNFFASARDTLKRNQFGGTVGGPILKDKLFFFAAYQRTPQRSAPTQSTAFVPTAAMLDGNFSAFAQCNGLTLPGSLGFSNNMISPTLLSPVALNIAKTLPVTLNPCGRTLYGAVANQDEDLGAAKVDYQINERNSLFARFTVANLDVGSTYNGSNPLSINSYARDERVYSLALGETFVISPTIVSSFRAAASRTEIAKAPDDYESYKDFGANITPLGGENVYLTVSGAFSIGGSNAVPGHSYTGPNPSVSEELTVSKGAHQIVFGGNMFHQSMNYASGVNATGQASFSGQTSGSALVDFLLGDASAFSQGSVYGFYNRQNYFSLYAQDTWKATPRLTINAGLRWEPYNAVYSKYPTFGNFTVDGFESGQHSTVYTNAPAGLIFSGDPSYTCGNSINCDRWGLLSPRVGLAWDPKGTGKMTIRASYGLLRDRSSMFFYNYMTQAPPYGNNITLANVNIQNPWAGYPGGNPMPVVVNKNTAFPLYGGYATNPLSYAPPYTNQWNLSIQRQLGENWLFTASYIGNSSIHLQATNQLNPGVFLGLNPCTLAGVSYSTCSTTSNINQRRVLSLLNPAQGQYYSGIGYVDDGGTGTYDALYVAAQKRMSRGTNVLANYTWSHCISDVWSSEVDAGNQIAAYPGNRRAYRSNCAQSDVRQVFNLSVVMQTPKFSRHLLRLLASNWQIAPILTIKSAQFFTVTSGTDRALSGQIGETPNLVGNPYPAVQTVGDWINKAAFANPALGSYGNLGQNNLKGPGSLQLNLAVSRTFPVWGEKRTLQVRCEAFNLPNTLNPSTPVSTWTASNFGQITSDISGNNGLTAGDQRILQLAMKFTF